MSGERAFLIKNRAEVFLKLARELINRNILDIASFHIHQALQLRLKATLFRLRGSMPRIHRIRELIGMLATTLDEINFRQPAERIRDFTRKYRDILIDIEASYIESRYGLATPSKSVIKNMLNTTTEFFKLLDEVEKSVLG